MTCRLFIDEVGTATLRGSMGDPHNRYLSLTGVLTTTAFHNQTIAPEIERLKVDVFGESVGPSPIILHRREIVRREGPFVILRDERRADEFGKRILGIVRSAPYLAITVAIDKWEHLNRYTVWHFDPYHYCLRCLVERYVLWMRRHDQVGDVVVEPRYQKADKKLKASFQHIYANGTEHMPARLVQHHLTSREIKFEPKERNIAGLQLCDLIAHPSLRAMRRAREKEPRLRDFGYQIADALEERRYARNPQNGAIDGWGKKWLP